MTAHHSPSAGLREWLGLAVLALPCLLVALDLNLLHMALPHLSADLRPSSTQMLWIIDIYGFMIAGFLITMGKLGDRIGRRKLLLVGASAFGIASLFAAYSTSAEMLIITRALLGMAGATLMPSTLSLIRNMFQNPQQRATAISIWMTFFMVGTAIGPVVGGVLLEFFWWGSVFLLAIPVMVMLLIVGPILLPEYREQKDDHTQDHIDLLSVGLSLVTIISLIYGLKEMTTEGLQLWPILAIIFGVFFGIVFIYRQNALPNPLLDMNLFTNRTFSSALIIMLLGMIAVSGLMLFIPQYLQMVEGMSPLQASFWMMPAISVMICGNLLSSIVARWFRPGYVIVVGLCIAVVGYITLTQVDPITGLTTMIVSSMMVLFGTTPMMTLGTDLIIGSAPLEKAGSASSMSETSMELGAALGIAVLGSVGTVVYRHQLASSIPDGVPEDSIETTLDSLANAIAVAEQLPNQLAIELLIPAREAFTNGINIVGWVNAFLLVILIFLAFVTLRHVHPSSEEKPPAK